jgi:hypothetical protein
MDLKVLGYCFVAIMSSPSMLHLYLTAAFVVAAFQTLFSAFKSVRWVGLRSHRLLRKIFNLKLTM